MKFLEALRCGHEPRCTGCVYFDRRAVGVVNSTPIIGGGPRPPTVVVGGFQSDVTGTCREGSPTCNGWLTLPDGSKTYCGKWDDGEETARPSSDGRS